MSKVFYDWKFYENGQLIKPLSLGMVGHDNRELYIVNKDFDWDNCPNQWLHQNVKPGISDELITEILPQKEIGDRILDWLEPYAEQPQEIELISEYCAYDHVLLAQQFGDMSKLPVVLPMWTRDLKQWCSDLGNPLLPIQKDGTLHHALADARWVRDAYNYLVNNFLHPAWRNVLSVNRVKL